MSKYKSGLRRIRNFGLSRRNFNKGALGAAALTGLATAGIPGIANAATDVTFLGWEGYDAGLFVDNYLAEITERLQKGELDKKLKKANEKENEDNNSDDEKEVEI